MTQPAVSQPGSAYFLADSDAKDIRTTLAVLVDNEPGVLARVVGLFSARGYNIESLTVAETDHDAHTSRITIMTSGTPKVLEQIKAQLGRLVPVQRVIDFYGDDAAIRRELALIKVAGDGDDRLEALRLADAFKAKVMDATLTSFVFEMTGSTKKIDDFIALMRPLGLVEVSRTGIAAIRRGPEAL
jgi:acetolactate synthase I/III small subunit